MFRLSVSMEKRTGLAELSIYNTTQGGYYKSVMPPYPESDTVPPKLVLSIQRGLRLPLS